MFFSANICANVRGFFAPVLAHSCSPFIFGLRRSNDLIVTRARSHLMDCLFACAYFTRDAFIYLLLTATCFVSCLICLMSRSSTLALQDRCDQLSALLSLPCHAETAGERGGRLAAQPADRGARQLHVVRSRYAGVVLQGINSTESLEDRPNSNNFLDFFPSGYLRLSRTRNARAPLQPSRPEVQGPSARPPKEDHRRHRRHPAPVALRFARQRVGRLRDLRLLRGESLLEILTALREARVQAGHSCARHAPAAAPQHASGPACRQIGDGAATVWCRKRAASGHFPCASNASATVDTADNGTDARFNGHRCQSGRHSDHTSSASDARHTPFQQHLHARPNHHNHPNTPPNVQPSDAPASSPRAVLGSLVGRRGRLRHGRLRCVRIATQPLVDTEEAGRRCGLDERRR